MICSLCELPATDLIDEVCIRCIEDGANLPDELICSDYGFGSDELDLEPEPLSGDSPLDRLGD